MCEGTQFQLVLSFQFLEFTEKCLLSCHSFGKNLSRQKAGHHRQRETSSGPFHGSACQRSLDRDDCGYETGTSDGNFQSRGESKCGTGFHACGSRVPG